MFSPTFLHYLILTALVWTGAGALTLLVLLFKDWKNGTLW